MIAEEFGNEVVIVSTKQVAHGIEIVFACAQNTLEKAREAQPPRPEQAQASRAPLGQAVAAPNTEALAREIEQLKALVQQQFSQMSWQSWASGDPMRGQLWQDLQDLGFSPMVGRTLVDSIPQGLNHSQASAWVIEAITSKLTALQPEVEMVQKGGVYAVVGPTGSGKTTTIAKIAARCMALKGRNSVALITTDTYRICAIDQLRTYGKVIGVPVHVALHSGELEAHLQAVKGKHLVLIDTMGLSPRDVQVTEQIGLLDHNEIHKLLVMNVASQPRALAEMADRFRGNGFYGACLTKLDECSTIAGTIDLALRENLNLMYMSTGQKVPEDLFLADPQFLVQRAMRRQYDAAYARTEEELNWLRYGVANDVVRSDVRRT